MQYHNSHHNKSMVNDRTTVAEMIVSQLFSGQTYAEETLAITFVWVFPLMKVLKAKWSKI